jgi:hypothetical protein
MFAYARHRTSRTITSTITAIASRYPSENHGLRLRFICSLLPSQVAPYPLVTDQSRLGYAGTHDVTIVVLLDIRRRLMDQDERQERESREFEEGREVYEEQTRNISEEADEEDRQLWEKNRDIRKEASKIPEESPAQHQREDPGQRERIREEREEIEHQEEEKSREQRIDDQLEAPPGD